MTTYPHRLYQLIDGFTAFKSGLETAAVANTIG